MQHSYREYQPIENYGIIGNMKTAALISLSGSLDFMSFPRFDSPTIFASILDANKGGYFSIEPQMENMTSKQLYMPGTAILITRFFSETGIVEIADYMPVDEANKDDSYCSIVRRVSTVRGQIDFKVYCCPRFDYAQVEHSTEKQGNSLTFEAINDGGAKVRLIADIPLQNRGNDGYAEFNLREGESAYIVLESVEEGEEERFSEIEYYSTCTYYETIKYWRKWLSKSTYKGNWKELVARSAITLKLMTSAAFGSLIASPTFALPETLGGNRNWDYRFTWIRDAAFTLYSFLKLGFAEEAKHFMDWIYKQCVDKDLQLIYKLDGGTELKEVELPHLEGYKGSKPVRVGNGASEQLQLDIYGELLDTIYIYNKNHAPITYEFWSMIYRQVEKVVEHWQEPDHGIWEIRNEKKEFLHTRLMCWVAMDRGIKIAEHRSFPYPMERWRSTRDAIYHDIYHNFWDEELGAWVQHKGSKSVDASALLMPLVHFITSQEPRWLSTLEAIDRELRLDVLVYRYQNHIEKIDGLDGEEGTFNMCSFWYVECLAKSGQLDRAIENFEKLLGYSNHLGLFSEQIGKRGEHLGNFPQAFTHLALISAALEMDKQIGRRNGYSY